MNKEASHYVKLFGGTKIGNLTFWLPLVKNDGYFINFSCFIQITLTAVSNKKCAKCRLAPWPLLLISTTDDESLYPHWVFTYPPTAFETPYQARLDGESNPQGVRSLPQILEAAYVLSPKQVVLYGVNVTCIWHDAKGTQKLLWTHMGAIRLLS